MANRTGSTVAHIKLGEHTIEVRPQKLARLRRKLAAFGSNMVESDVDLAGSDFLAVIGDQAYELLRVFLPDDRNGDPFMPRYEWDGYASQTAADQDQYDEDADRSVDAEQLVVAFKQIMAVNKLDLFKQLGKVVDPTMLRAWLTTAAADFLTQNSTPGSLPQASDGTSSATAAPTTPTTAPTPTPA